MTFRQKLEAITKKNNSLLCIGLDPEIEKLPKHLIDADDPIFDFNKAIIDATHDLVCVYKPNSAFYEAYGLAGHHALKKTINYIHQMYPEIPVLLDAKRADIPNTAKMYAKAAFEYWNADAVTVYPYLGYDAVEPFLRYRHTLTILLIKTSNPHSKVIQDLKVNGIPHFLAMAKIIKKWTDKNIGIFVGATYPSELDAVRKLFPHAIFLSAGLGAQAAQIKKAVQAGIDTKKRGIMFNASRSILYASKGEDFAEKAREEAMRVRDEINKYRS